MGLWIWDLIGLRLKIYFIASLHTPHILLAQINYDDLIGVTSFQYFPIINKPISNYDVERPD